jgi:SAM-dependent methyltransferase
MKGIETRKLDKEREESGFYHKYLQGTGLDVGYKGLGLPDGIEPVRPNAVGVDLDFPGYDGKTLPFPDESQDFVFASHVLEHIPDYVNALKDWHRVLKINGHMVLLLPHAYLYERSYFIPGPWGSCADHKRVYTPARLLREIEESLLPNTYRVISLRDNDQNFNYGIGLRTPPDYFGACFEIELVLKKIKPPIWDIK